VKTTVPRASWARWRVRLLAALTAVLALLLPGPPASASTSAAAQTRVGASRPAVSHVVGVHECIRAGQRPVRGPSQLRLVVGHCVAAEGIPDATVIVRGSQGELPPPGEVFSGSLGSTLEDAAAGVRHGTVRSTTAGDIRAGGGTVEPNPELDPRVGQTNYQHIDVCLGLGPCPFGEPIPNPVPKSGRLGFPDYPYERWTE